MATQQSNGKSYIPVRHNYSRTGVFRVTISGTCDNLYGYDGDVYAGAKRSDTLVHCLWGVIVPKDSTSPLKYGYGSFFGCQNLKHIGYGVFHNITECKEVPHLYDGAILSRIEPWMLYGGYNLESISYTFENCQMLEIDPNVFKNCTKITDASHCFHRCDALLSIPEGLFDYTPKLSDISVCFKSCTRVKTVPQNLFDNCPNITNCEYCFSAGRHNGDNSYSGTMSITTAIPPLWKRTNIRSFTSYAYGCINATNYNQAVVNGWAL